MKLALKTGAGLSLALLLLVGMFFTVHPTHTARADTALVYPVDAQTAAGGVYARTDPHANDTSRIDGYGAYPGDQVQLLCGVTDGDGVGQYNNTTWHFVEDLNNTGEGDFWIADHYLDTPNPPSQLTLGESLCPNEGSNPLQQAGSLPCTPILVIGARGSGNPYQQDATGLWGFDSPLSQLANGLLSYYGKNNVTAYGLPYPADPIGVLQHLDNVVFSGGYDLSVKYGVEDLTATVMTQAQACPLQLIDLVGYSQGANVVNTTIPQLPQSVRGHINGVVTFGDPQFGGQNAEDSGSYNPADNGIKATLSSGPRSELPADILTKARSYCDDTDYICNVSPKSLSAGNSGHFAYAQTHVPEAEQFLESLTIVNTGNF